MFKSLEVDCWRNSSTGGLNSVYSTGKYDCDTGWSINKLVSYKDNASTQQHKETF